MVNQAQKNYKYITSVLINILLIITLFIVWLVIANGRHLPDLQGSFSYMDRKSGLEEQYSYIQLIFDNVSTRGTYSMFRAMDGSVEHGFVAIQEDGTYLLQCEYGVHTRRVIRKNNETLYLVNDDVEVLIFERFNDLAMRFGFLSPRHLWSIDMGGYEEDDHILSDSEHFLLQDKINSLLLDITDIYSAGVAVRAVVGEPVHVAVHLNIAQELNDKKISEIISILNSALTDFSSELALESANLVIIGVLNGEATIIYSNEG